MSYKDLEIWKLSRELVSDIHSMTINYLPNYEMYEEGSRIRRSIKSVRSTIVEGYGRRECKEDFLRYLYFVIASNDETVDHLEILYETKSLKEKKIFEDVHSRLEILGEKINLFIKSL